MSWKNVGEEVELAFRRDLFIKKKKKVIFGQTCGKMFQQQLQL